MLRKAESWEEENFRSGLLDVFDDVAKRLGGLVTHLASRQA